jgi:hypothetical protein
MKGTINKKYLLKKYEMEAIGWPNVFPASSRDGETNMDKISAGSAIKARKKVIKP